MQGITSHTAGGNFAVLTQGFPQLVQASARRSCIRTIRAHFSDHGAVICQVRMVNEYPLIPDFERLEEMISEETRAA